MAVTVPEILVDADTCPVKDEVYRVAGRYELNVRIVANSFMMVPQSPLIEGVIVGSGFDAADAWIAEHASPSALLVTSDILLAERSVTHGATVPAPTGWPFDMGLTGKAVAQSALGADLSAR